jgi:Phage minor capsid protein 2.
MQSKEAQALIDKYANMQQDIFDILIKQLQQANMSETTADNVLQWQLEALSKTGALTKEVVKTVAKVNKTTSKDVENLVSQLGLQAVSDVQSEIKQHTSMKGNLTPDIDAMIEAYAKPMQKSLTKVVNEGLIDRNTRTNAAARVYKDIVNKTTLEVMSGLKTHEQAVRDNVYRWVDKGIPTKLTDRAGKGWSLEGYSRTVITTASRQVFNEMRKETMSVNGVHLAKMSWHACARPACAPIQGHVVSSLPTSDPRYNPKYPSIFDYGYGEPSGTMGINCEHIFTPWDPDVNIDHQDEDMPTPQQAIKQGKVQQKQRQQERAIRQTKKLIDAAEKLGDGDKVVSLKKRLARQQAKVRKIVKDNDFLSRDYSREQIAK